MRSVRTLPAGFRRPVASPGRSLCRRHHRRPVAGRQRTPSRRLRSGAAHVVALRHVEVDPREFRRARQLALRKIRLDRMQRLLDPLLMGDFTGHEEAKRVLDARIVGHVDQPLIDDLCARFRRDVGAQIGGRLADGVDIGCCPRYPGGVRQGSAGAVKERRNVRVIAGSGQTTIPTLLLPAPPRPAGPSLLCAASRQCCRSLQGD